MKQNLIQKLFFVSFLLIAPAAFAQGNNDFAPVPGELEQAGRRSSRKFFIGGFTANGLSWFGSGIQFSSKLAASLQWQEQRVIQRFDLDVNGVQPDLSGVFTLTNSEKIQRQLALQMEWFPFSGPYYFAAGAGLETYSEKQRKTEGYVPGGNYRDYAWNISQQKLFLSAGAGFRYIFTSGFFIHVGGNILFYPERGTHEQRGSYATNTSWDYRQLQKDWQEPEKEARSHQNPYGAQLQILFGIAI
ncbi:hypothetical protein [Leptospira koniambonensis]|uniref:hypothetical protein n=1 Tax=Leptospira koniambonensis TaxID=2484950 RepID=UPI003EB78A98